MVLILVAAALAVLFLIAGLRRRTSTGVKRLHAISGAEEPDATPARSGLSAAVGAIMDVPARLMPRVLSDRLGAGLDRAAPLSGFTPERLLGVRVFGMVLLPAALLFATRFSRAAVLVALPLSLAGAALPVMLANRNRNSYLDSVRRGLPQTADMLYALVLGGKNLDQAFKGAAVCAPEPLAGLLARTVREMDLGATRSESFARLEKSCPLEELSSLLRSLIEAEKRGHPLGPTLGVFSREIRMRERDRLKVAVAKAPVKMLAPLVFLILPAAVMLTVGPTLLASLQKLF
ncbi:MAG: type II secretion system F family protein [Actinobacteria bacterium]|nr:type II secretion system F family protein [Actinomycetota bacterium]MBU1942509.1 type II secretion system F family protein [Actinomycetota bacterium]MBU2687237.1 type II secretion system F family protein [Actinomycetota bacterium]